MWQYVALECCDRLVAALNKCVLVMVILYHLDLNTHCGNLATFKLNINILNLAT